MSSKKKQDDDERFRRVQKDPRFWEMPERERKVKIDKRFRSMFTDDRFKVKYTVDKRGRPIHQTSTEDLKRFYKVSDSEEEEEEEEGRSKKAAEDKKKEKPKEETRKGKAAKSGGGEQPGRGVRLVEEGDEEDEDDSEDDDEEEEEEEEESGVDEEDEESGVDSDSDSELDLARGKGNVETSSDEDDDDDVDTILRKEEEDIKHDWGELAKDAPRSDEVSTRLAVCNMDWDRIKAKDLLALFSSFIPKGGAVLSVKVYPSEFGKERLKAEETQGPLELRALPDDSEDDTEEQRGYREKMRDYQFKRLKYFYAVVECDSVDTAAKVYQECDGYEYESSCSMLDLRFVPDDVTFDEEPRDIATDVNLSAYTPKLFTSSANVTSKVELTWDETDNDRVAALNRKFNKDELLAMDFNAYLASSSEEEEEEEGGGGAGGGAFDFGHQDGGDSDTKTTTAEAQTVTKVSSRNPKKEEQEEEEQEEEEKAQKGRRKQKKRSEEQISKYRELLKGLQDKEKKLQEDKDMEMEITWVPGLKETTEQLVKKKLEGSEQRTPWEDFLQRKKDKKKKKKKKESQNKEDEDDEDISDDELPPDVDLNDPFFSEELADMKKKQKGKKKKKKPGEEEERTAEEEEELEKQRAEMELLMDDDDKHKHFNYDQIVEQQNLSRKKKKKLLKKGEQPPEEDHFQVDVKDSRFQAMFTSHLFNLDPSHPSFKRTRATDSFLAEKRRRRERGDDTGAPENQAGAPENPAEAPENPAKAPDNPENPSRNPVDPGLAQLIKSVKSKTQQFQSRKKKLT